MYKWINVTQELGEDRIHINPHPTTHPPLSLFPRPKKNGQKLSALCEMDIDPDDNPSVPLK